MANATAMRRASDSGTDVTMRITIDGRPVELPEGATVLDGVNRLGIALPQLCKDPDRPPLGACRTCLVHVEGMRGTPAACHLPARDGMVVSTLHPDAVRVRSTVLDLTLSMLAPSSGTPARDPGQHLSHRDGPRDPGLAVAPRHDFGQATDAAARHGVRPSWAPLHHHAVDATKSFFVLDRDACILCGRCTTACDDVQQIGAIALLGRGHATRVGVFGDGTMASSVCTSCGQCVATCPTGALRPKEAPAPVLRRVETTCPYCGVGCGIEVAVRNGDGERLAMMADDVPGNRSSLGMLCVKGRFGTGFVHARDRITRPMVRRDGRWVEVSWDEALETAADGLARHRGRFGALASAKATNEDGYVVQKFCRVVMGTNNVDHCTRLCHSPSVEAMLVSMGSGATSNSYQDYEEAGCLMVVGADASANHPVIAIRFRRAVSRGARLIVVNPRRIELCDQADLWIRQRPGTDVALFNAMARVILDEGLANEAFIRDRTEGFEAWRASLEPYTLEYAERVTGVPAGDIARAARWYARPPFSGSCLIWGMGITQHVCGTANAHALLNLSLVAGQMGFPGSGISPLRGQNNVQGCGDAGCIPTNLPGYARYDPATLDRFEKAWGVRPPGETGLVVTEMVEGCLDGRIRAMYVVGENPLLSEPDLHHAEKALGQLDFLVVQDLFLHETAERAHVFLPAATFAEKEGTFTNSERRVQRVRAALAPRGEARPDWWITAELARRVARRVGLDVGAQFDYASAAQVFDEMARLVPFLGGISHARLDREGGLQWPCPTPDHPGTRYLYAESFPRGRARFVPALQTVEGAELPDADYPYVLNTGRLLYHWHGGTLTRRVQGLLELAPRLEVAIHPADARRLGVDSGGRVRVASRRGELTGYAHVTEAVRPGAIFVPFVKLADSAANFLTNAAHDPESKIPEYKLCAVRLEALPD
ncbi:MAG TPA: formate dehydrogenase subunit alpha [Candidatus Tectomicrobia bacterium]|nr:formate dehydrogenase subunit alpha [Candidatus Tectomicrobia bacterium]